MKSTPWIATAVIITALVGHTVTTADEHPFTLVNVVDLFELYALGEVDETFDPITQQPSNWNEYVQAPRIGTNPAVVTTDGDRAWIGGFYNGPNFNRYTQPVEENRIAWYASVGVAEVANITTQSGYGGDWVRYLDTFQVGPGIQNTDWFSGLDYDATTKTLYIASDAILPPFSTIMPDQGLPWQFYDTYIAAVDADPESPTYSQMLWQNVDPIITNPQQGGRCRAGVSIDPYDPTWLAYPVQGWGDIAFFDVTNPFADPLWIHVTDEESLQCNSTAIRGHDFHPVTGEWYARVLNGIQYVPRDTRTQVAPYQVYSRFIREPQGGNGIVDTLALGDDLQIVPFGDPIDSSNGPVDVVGVGPNGVLDTVPAGDEVFSVNKIVTERILGNPDGNCPTDPDGFPSGEGGGNPQGQGIAIIPSYNIADFDVDLLLVNNRPRSSGGQETDIRFFTTDGTEFATLELPCAPHPEDNPPHSGVALYDFDYDPATGTLVLIEFERRLLFVYRVQLDGGPAYPRFDYTRNGTLDLNDFAGFQACFTGPTNEDGLSLNCMRMNSDSDCDVDFDDWLQMADLWDAIGSP